MTVGSRRPYVVLQHCICEGPGHKPASEVPAQSEVHPQAEPEPWQDGLEQQRTSAASQGQAPDIVVPPPDSQSEELMQTPARPSGP